MKLHSLARHLSVSDIPVSSQFNTFLQLGLLALHARSFLHHKPALLSGYD